MIYITKQEGLYQNKVNFSLVVKWKTDRLQGRVPLSVLFYVYCYFSLSLRNFDLERSIKGLFLAIVIKIHLFNIQWTETFSLTNGYPFFLRSYGSLPWPLCKCSPPVMHYGSVVVRNSQAVNRTMAILLKVVLVFWGYRQDKCNVFT